MSVLETLGGIAQAISLTYKAVSKISKIKGARDELRESTRRSASTLKALHLCVIMLSASNTAPYVHFHVLRSCTTNKSKIENEATNLVDELRA